MKDNWQGWIVIAADAVEEDYTVDHYNTLDAASKCITNNDLDCRGNGRENVSYRLFKAYEIPVKIEETVTYKVTIGDIPTFPDLTCKSIECSRRKK